VTAVQPRDALGQFASKACPRMYAMLDEVAADPLAPVERPNFYAVPAPRCPHGHFQRWARLHCRRCLR
jgi:hypothetical protein